MRGHNRAMGIEWLFIVAAGIVISAVLIAVFAGTARKAKASTAPAVEAMSATGRAMAEANIVMLDGEEVEGCDVRNFYAKYLDDYTGTYTSPFEVVIDNGASVQAYSTRDYLAAIKDPTDTLRYVKASHIYACSVVRNANGEIEQVRFTVR